MNEFNIGTWVYVVNGGSGAKGTDNQVGCITDKLPNRGFVGRSRYIYAIEFLHNFGYGENTIWGLPKECILRLADIDEIKQVYKDYIIPKPVKQDTTYLIELLNKLNIN